MQQAAAFDPRILARLQAMQAHAAQQEPALDPLFGQLLGEAGGGPRSRPPEAVAFSAARGDLAARQQLASFNASRDKAMELLMRGVDPVAFERFMWGQRAAAQQHPSYNPFGILSDALGQPGR